jgi:hypothetical protein
LKMARFVADASPASRQPGESESDPAADPAAGTAADSATPARRAPSTSEEPGVVPDADDC